MRGAIFGAFAAPDTFIGVDGGEEIVDVDGIVLTHLGALTARDASHRTRLTGNGAFIMTGTTYHAFGGGGVHHDEIFGTRGHTLGTTTAQRGVDLGKTVLHFNGAVLAHRHAVAVAKAAVLALPVATVKQVGRRAGGQPVIFQFAGSMRFATTAAHECRFNLHFTVYAK